jgi:pimeloyl-ACP methyl ester carboxylesterase
VDGAKYFCTLLPNAKSVIFEDCGHFMAIDKPEEVAQSMITFYNEHYNN